MEHQALFVGGGSCARTSHGKADAATLVNGYDQAYRGRKLGGALLWDAVQRCLRSELAVFALVVDAKDDQAEGFYRHHGFVPFGGQPRQRVLPLTDLVVKG